jgi:uncharacterized protein (TIGR03086 family)
LTVVDLGPAAERMAGLVTNVPDELLDRPTPCQDYSVGDMLDHLAAMAMAFTAAATKQTAGIGDQRPEPHASHLPPDWRTRIPRDITGLAEAWREPAAWDGMTRAGGVDMPGEIAGVVALDELVIHGWDLARATGQPFDVDDQSLAAVHTFVSQAANPENEAMRGDLFGPPVGVPVDAPLLDRVIGLTGRDPEWAPVGQ